MKKSDKDKLRDDLTKAKGKPVTVPDLLSAKLRAKGKGKGKEQFQRKNDPTKP